jgi:hypothetical protein
MVPGRLLAEHQPTPIQQQLLALTLRRAHELLVEKAQRAVDSASEIRYKLAFERLTADRGWFVSALPQNKNPMEERHRTALLALQGGVLSQSAMTIEVAEYTIQCLAIEHIIADYDHEILTGEVRRACPQCAALDAFYRGTT